MRKLIIIETSDIGARYTAEAAKRLGYEPLFICQLRNYQADTLKQLREFKCIDASTGDAELIVESLRGVDEIAGVITFLDSRLAVAVEVAEILGVPGLEKSLLPLKDKGYVHGLAPQFMPESLMVDSRNFDYGEVERFFSRHGKCILKPRKMAGAIGARIFSSLPTEQELREHFSSTPIPGFLDPHAWILQAFMPGRLVSLEGFMDGDSFHPLGITGRRKVGQTESVAHFPADEELPIRTLNWAHEACRTLLTAAGIKSSYFHIEFITGDQGNAIIDANIGRMGGGGVGELLALSFEIDPVDVFVHVIAHSLGQNPSSPYFQRRHSAISIFYGVPHATVIENLENLELIQGYHTQILDLNKHVPAMGSDNWAWIGIATGLNPQLLSQMEQVRIQTQQGSVSPCY